MTFIKKINQREVDVAEMNKITVCDGTKIKKNYNSKTEEKGRKPIDIKRQKKRKSSTQEGLNEKRNQRN